MAYSYIQYTGNGADRLFTAPAYLEKDHISVLVDGVSATFTWNNDQQVRMDAIPGAGLSVIVKRTTQRSARLVDFSNASLLRESTLDLDANQLFYLIQEILDEVVDRLGLTDDNLGWDAGGLQIKNVADPTDPQDAVTLYYLLNTFSGNLLEILPGAEAAQLAAELAETNAELAETNAESAEARAREWADNNQNVQISFAAGHYSAKHWAAIAQSGAGAFPSGTKLYFYQNTAPAGWTIDNNVADALLGIKGGANAFNVNGGNLVGTWAQPNHTHDLGDHTHTAGAHTHDLGSHTHTGGAHTHGAGNLSGSFSHTHLPGGTVQSGFAATLSQDGVNAYESDYGTGTASLSGTTGSDGAVATGAPSSNSSGSAGAVATGTPSSNATGNGAAANTYRPYTAVGIIAIKD
jgi:hypothetical protein